MSNAITSSAALVELKTNLTKLSATLHEIFDLMNADMSQIGQEWQDGKYQEFVDGYKPQIQKCEDVSVRYSEWCRRVLEPTIENVIAVEKTDVGSGGGSVGSVSASTIGTMAGVGATGAVAMGAVGGMAGGFNMGGEKVRDEITSFVNRNKNKPASDSLNSNKEKENGTGVNNSSSQETQSGVIPQIDAYLNKPKTPKSLSKLDKECLEKVGLSHGELGTPSDYNIISEESYTETLNDKITSGLGANFFVEGKLGSEKGKIQSRSSTDKIFLKCK